MSAEPRRVTKAEIWTEWESQVVNGIYPLRRFLGGSDHSAVFLTEYKAENLADVAIKFVPADMLQTEAQLVQWGAAATLSHPHLIRLFDVGRCQLGGRGFLFVVMEYAEQTLGQILPQRALSPDEVREMLLPTLDALAFLHRNHLVHGKLKPSNFLVVNDRLKLTSDTVRPIGHSTSGIDRTSPYDPPELQDGEISTAGDVWGLGITLVEALTQHTPGWTGERREMSSLPAGFPAPFVDTVRRCLSVTPADRPTLTEIETQYKPAPQAHATLVPQPLAGEEPRAAPPAQNLPRRHVLLPAIGAALLLSFAIWVGLSFSQRHSNPRESTSGTSQARLQPAAVPVPVAAAAIAKSAQANSELSSPVARSPDQPSPPPADTSPSVLHEVTPEVSRVIGARIHGHINVTVRVLVDPAGNVVGEFLERAGPSRYFARLAGDAAVEWKFAPAEEPGPRVWLLRFEFNRGGATVQATAAQ
jgi:serine/threonine protein kinase